MKHQIDYIISQLHGYFPSEELRDLAYWIVEETTGLTRTQVLTGCKGTENIPNIEIILEKLRNHEPIQYVFGHTEWMGLDLLVNSSTLIPRPETAELVEWILEKCDTQSTLHVTDIGTGSGCIAIALKKRSPKWQVSGVDISDKALQIAAKNSVKNNVMIEWKKINILEKKIDEVDIVVSNPPYICEKEKKEMDARVLDYEPHQALFVPDNDPLLFYRRICEMKKGKYVFFEINEAYGKEMCSMMKSMGYVDVEIKNDIYGKARMVFGRIEK